MGAKKMGGNQFNHSYQEANLSTCTSLIGLSISETKALEDFLLGIHHASAYTLGAFKVH
jgi:hypothetical protein